MKGVFKIVRVLSQQRRIKLLAYEKVYYLQSTNNVIFKICGTNLLIEKLANYRSHWGGHLAYVFVKETLSV